MYCAHCHPALASFPGSPRTRALFRTASDGKLDVAWVQGQSSIATHVLQTAVFYTSPILLLVRSHFQTTFQLLYIQLSQHEMLQHNTPVTMRVSFKESVAFSSLHSTTDPFSWAVAVKVRMVVISTGLWVVASSGNRGRTRQCAELPLKVQVKVTISSGQACLIPRLDSNSRILAAHKEMQ